MSTKTPDLSITKATVDDVEAICEIQAVTWLDTYPNPELGITKAAIRQRIEGANGQNKLPRIAKWRSIITASGPGTGQTYVARLDGQVVGFGSARIDEQNRRTIGALYVLPEAQRLGVGRKLMRHILDWLGSDQDIYVIAASYNDKAINFYKSCGFQMTSRHVVDTAAQATGDIEIPEIEMVLPA